MDVYQSVVITGGDGLLARAMARSLEARGIPFMALSHSACDITREKDVYRVFRDCRPSLLLNCAAYTKVNFCEDEPDRADATNGYALRTLASLSREHRTYLVHFSTDAVFDGSTCRPYRPTDPVGPLSAYGRSKLLGEHLLQEHAPARWVIVRTAWLFGTNGTCFPRTILERAWDGRALRVVDDQVGSPTYASDLADAVLQLIDRGGHGIWHIANSGQASWFELAAATLEEFGISADLAPIDTAEWLKMQPKQARRAPYSVLDTAAVAELIGEPLRSWREALRAYRRAVTTRGLTGSRAP